MTDLEMTRLCAEAMYPQVEVDMAIKEGCVYAGPEGAFLGLSRYEYDPLHDDAQAMALVKKFRLWIDNDNASDFHTVGFKDFGTYQEDLNRAIVECVAKMQSAKVNIKS
mgnify:CR=1 FL=1